MCSSPQSKGRALRPKHVVLLTHCYYPPKVQVWLTTASSAMDDSLFANSLLQKISCGHILFEAKYMSTLYDPYTQAIALGLQHVVKLTRGSMLSKSQVGPITASNSTGSQVLSVLSVDSAAHNLKKFLNARPPQTPLRQANAHSECSQ